MSFQQCWFLQELDVDTEMQRGLLPGAMALSAKFVPVVQRVSQRTAEAVKDFVNDPKALSDKVARPSSAPLLGCCCLSLLLLYSVFPPVI